MADLLVSGPSAAATRAPSAREAAPTVPCALEVPTITECLGRYAAPRDGDHTPTCTISICSSRQIIRGRRAKALSLAERSSRSSISNGMYTSASMTTGLRGRRAPTQRRIAPRRNSGSAPASRARCRRVSARSGRRGSVTTTMRSTAARAAGGRAADQRLAVDLSKAFGRSLASVRSACRRRRQG